MTQRLRLEACMSVLNSRFEGRLYRTAPKRRMCYLRDSVAVPSALLPGAARPGVGRPLSAPLLIPPFTTALRAFGAFGPVRRIAAFATLWWRIRLALVFRNSASVTSVRACNHCSLCGATGILDILEHASSRAAARARAEVLDLGCRSSRRCRCRCLRHS